MAYSVESPGTVALRKEMLIRRKMSKIYNRRQDDFSTLREYNDYLEEVEDMTYNWVAGVDVEAIKAKVEQYQLQNSELIANNEAKMVEERSNALKYSDVEQLPQDEFEAPRNLPGQMESHLHYRRQPYVISYTKPPPPEDEAAEEKQRRAGGWDPSHSHRRAYQEFLDTLFL